MMGGMRSLLGALVGVVALAGLTACTGGAPLAVEPTVAPASVGDVVPESARTPEPTATQSATPSPTPTRLSVVAAGPLKCREANVGERWMPGGEPIGKVWVVDIADGYRIVAAKYGRGRDDVSSVVTNGTRVNFTYDRDPEPFRFRVLPVEFPDGFDAIDLAEACAARGHA